MLHNLAKACPEEEDADGGGEEGKGGLGLTLMDFHFTVGQFRFNPFLVLAEKREIGFLFSNVSNLYSASLNTS